MKRRPWSEHTNQPKGNSLPFFLIWAIWRMSFLHSWQREWIALWYHHFSRWSDLHQTRHKSVQFLSAVQKGNFSCDFIVTPLLGCDMILGIQWFQNHTPMPYDNFTLVEGVHKPVIMTKGDQSVFGIPLNGHFRTFPCISSDHFLHS